MSAEKPWAGRHLNMPALDAMTKDPVQREQLEAFAAEVSLMMKEVSLKHAPNVPLAAAPAVAFYWAVKMISVNTDCDDCTQTYFAWAQTLRFSDTVTYVDSSGAEVPPPGTIIQ